MWVYIVIAAVNGAIQSVHATRQLAEKAAKRLMFSAWVLPKPVRGLHRKKYD